MGIACGFCSGGVLGDILVYAFLFWSMIATVVLVLIVRLTGNVSLVLLRAKMKNQLVTVLARDDKLLDFRIPKKEPDGYHFDDSDGVFRPDPNNIFMLRNGARCMVINERSVNGVNLLDSQGRNIDPKRLDASIKHAALALAKKEQDKEKMLLYAGIGLAFVIAVGFAIYLLMMGIGNYVESTPEVVRTIASTIPPTTLPIDPGIGGII
jgi:preprotein translocase subunit Sss1